MTKKHGPVQEYFSEQFLCWDGEMHSRKWIIDELGKIEGVTQALIDRYMQGLDLSKRIRGRQKEAA